MSIAAAIILALFCAWAIYRPHAAGGAILDRGPAEDPLADQKSRCLQVLKDLELDYNTGKIGQADYDRTRASLASELAHVMEQMTKKA